MAVTEAFTKPSKSRSMSFFSPRISWVRASTICSRFFWYSSFSRRRR